YTDPRDLPAFPTRRSSDLRVACRERLIRADRIAVIQPGAAADNRRIVRLEVEAETRLEVRLVDRAAGLLERRHAGGVGERADLRSEEHTSELQSLAYLVCR